MNSLCRGGGGSSSSCSCIGVGACARFVLGSKCSGIGCRRLGQVRHRADRVLVHRYFGLVLHGRLRLRNDHVMIRHDRNGNANRLCRDDCALRMTLRCSHGARRSRSGRERYVRARAHGCGNTQRGKRELRHVQLRERNGPRLLRQAKLRRERQHVTRDETEQPGREDRTPDRATTECAETRFRKRYRKRVVLRRDAALPSRSLPGLAAAERDCFTALRRFSMVGRPTRPVRKPGAERAQRMSSTVETLPSPCRKTSFTRPLSAAK